ncbi:MAG: hypothetical protein ACK4I8_07785, partial [Armatimonadota bacterium]
RELVASGLSPTAVKFKLPSPTKGRRYNNFVNFKLPSPISDDATINSRAWDEVRQVGNSADRQMVKLVTGKLVIGKLVIDELVIGELVIGELVNW